MSSTHPVPSQPATEAAIGAFEKLGAIAASRLADLQARPESRHPSVAALAEALHAPRVAELQHIIFILAELAILLRAAIAPAPPRATHPHTSRRITAIARRPAHRAVSITTSRVPCRHSGAVALALSRTRHHTSQGPPFPPLRSTGVAA